MRIDNIYSLGNSGRITDAPSRRINRYRNVLRTVRFSPQRTAQKIGNECRRNSRTYEQAQQHNSQGSKAFWLLLVGARGGVAPSGSTPSDSENVQTKVSSRTHAQKVISNLFRNFRKVVFHKFRNGCSLAPVASRSFGTSRNNLKTSHPVDLMQLVSGSCEVFLRTVGNRVCMSA